MATESSMHELTHGWSRGGGEVRDSVWSLQTKELQGWDLTEIKSLAHLSPVRVLNTSQMRLLRRNNCMVRRVINSDNIDIFSYS